jgi:hypothetical protein
MLCNIQYKLVPYINAQFAEAVSRNRPAQFTELTPTIAFILESSRWLLRCSRVRLDYDANTDLETTLMTSHMGFVVTNRDKETRTWTNDPLDNLSTITLRTATSIWAPQLCESLFVCAPQLVQSDEFLMYNSTLQSPMVKHALHRLLLNTDEVVDPTGVYLFVEKPTWIRLAQCSFDWFDVDVVLMLPSPNSTSDTKIQALLRDVTSVSLCFRMQAKASTVRAASAI